MYVYLFVNLSNGKKYVGQTIREPNVRFADHLTRSKNLKAKEKQLITRAIHKHGWDGFSRHVLEVCGTQDELNAAEVRWIERYNCIAPHGYNLNSGGFAGGCLSEETKLKISVGLKGITKGIKTGPRTAETKLKMSKAAIGKKKSEATRAKMSQAQQNAKPTSEETRVKMSLAKRGKRQPKELVAKRARGATGQKRSVEVRELLSKLAKARPMIMSSESRAKAAEANRGKKRTPEQCARKDYTNIQHIRPTYESERWKSCIKLYRSGVEGRKYHHLW